MGTTGGSGERPLHELSARAAARGIAAGAFTSEAYVDALLAWQERWGVLNAYTQQDAAAARAAARRSAGVRSPVAGLPFAVKDNVDVAGYATTAGTPALRDHRPRVSAPLIQSLVDQGMVVMGKTGLHEWAAGGTCANITFGAIRNPYDTALVPGGSSGGSAAAVAGRLVPAAIGSDTAGSVRAPAAYCGCVGFKPTGGRYSRVGLVPGDIGRDTLGWLARSCDDIELLDACSAPAAAPAAAVELAGLRLGLPNAYFYEDLQPDVASVVEAALRTLRDAGVEFVEADVPEVGSLIGQMGPGGRDFAGGLSVYIEESGAAVTPADIVHGIADPQLRRNLEFALAAPAAPPGPTAADALRANYERYFADRGVAAVLIPTSPEAAYPIPEDIAAGGTGPVAMIRNTLAGAHARLPGLSMPAGLTAAGLPVGIELDGAPGADRTLIKIAQAIERVLPPLPAPAPPR
ncbi:MAG TPA: amidase family protein [Caulobacteraceae bacterium]|jgi:mandelamide amidase|nr:amidase family protein [Caulobacteraceae bacterium]